MDTSRGEQPMAEICNLPGAGYACSAVDSARNGLNGVGEAIGSAAANSVDGMLSHLGGSIAQAAGQLYKTLLTFWLNNSTPDLDSSSVVQGIQEKLSWYTALLAVVCLIIVGCRMALSASVRAAMDGLRGLAILSLASLAGVAIVGAVIKAGDAFTKYYLASVDTEKLGENFNWTATVFGNGSAIIIIVSGLVGLLAGLVQLMLLYVRFGVLVILVGILPLVAASATTQAGMAWLRRLIAWIAAFALYKPVAAVIYGVGLSMISDPNPIYIATGYLLTILAILALPALLKLAVPAIGAVSISGGSGGGVATASAVATGARMVVDIRGKGSHSVPKPAQTPTGSTPTPAPAPPRAPAPTPQPQPRSV